MIEVLLCVVMFCFGALASAGVFTVLSSVGLVPRFVGKTRSGKDIGIYEDMVMLGTIWGGISSVFPSGFIIPVPSWLGIVIVIAVGIFSGMFVGCIALAVAEMLDSIPIFYRRVHMKRGIGAMVFFIAMGKLCGSLYYFFVG